MIRTHAAAIGSGVLFLAAAGVFTYADWCAAGAWLALGCVALATVAYRVDAPSADTAASLEALRVDLAAGVANLRTAHDEHASVLASTDARVAAIMSFLQATQTYTTSRPTQPNGRPVSPLRNPLKT